MSEPTQPPEGEAPRSWHEKEYQDPHYHDEELDVEQNEGAHSRWPVKRRPARPRLPKRHYED